jgi:hypothetical protein
MNGEGFYPPDPSSQIFTDLPINSWAAKWIHQLFNDGYTHGCGSEPLVFCPWNGHTRAEGTVFYLRMQHGFDYIPPDPKGIFSDVPVSSWAAKWVEAAYNAGIIPACNEESMRFCPDSPLTRALAAYMMVQVKGLEPH